MGSMTPCFAVTPDSINFCHESVPSRDKKTEAFLRIGSREKLLK